MIDSLSPTVLVPVDSPRLAAAAPLPSPAAPTAAGTVPGEAAGRPWREAALVFVLSAVLALTTFALDGRNGLNLADEGYLRYGVRAIVEYGQVPMRDFQAYDPGRYYWAAGWSLLLGDGIVTTRLACTMFQVLGVGFALLALRRAGAGWGALVATGLIVTFWMLERFKLYEQCVSLIALYPAVRLIQQPDRRNAFLAGVFVGLAAFVGRNHGFYNVVAFGGLLALLAWKHRRLELLKLTVPWAGGIVVGYLPMLLMLAFVPGFFTAFVEGLHTLAHAKATNLTIPVPWPWTVKMPASQPAFLNFYALALSSCFLLLAAAAAGMLVVLLRVPGARLRDHAGLLAAAALSIPYAHYAFSRADAPHLAHSMPIMLIALLGLPNLLRDKPFSRKVYAALAGGLLAGTLLTTFIYNPVVGWLTRQGSDWTEVALGEQTINLNGDKARLVVHLHNLAEKEMAPDENILIAPDAPTLYEAVGRPSPLKTIYFLWPESPEVQREMIHDLETKRVNWVLLGMKHFDNKAERSLPYSHPLLFQYMRERFQPVQNSPFRQPYVLLHRTEPIPAK